jgi:exopolysaccharide biosynthesis protein
MPRLLIFCRRRIYLILVFAVSVVPANLAVVPAAHAAPMVSLRLSPKSVVEGGTTTVTGVVSGNVRRMVAFQVRRADGTWSTVLERRTDSAGTYEFNWTPTKPGTLKVRTRATRTATRSAVNSAAVSFLVRPANRNSDGLGSGSSLWPGQYLTSDNGRFRLRLGRDGRLTLIDRTTGGTTWSVDGGAGVQRATMQTDGNFVLVRSTGTPWSAGTQQFGGAKLMVQNDGNVVIKRNDLPVWSQDVGYVGDRLVEGLTLQAGDFLRSADRRFSFVMQGDGNLVEYDASGHALWASHTSGAGAYAVLQGDGNFVVYQGGQARWSSNSADFSDVQLRLQNDGNVVAYSQGLAVWASSVGYLGGRLASSTHMDPGDIRRSPNHRYYLVMQGDGNLVLYEVGGGALWASHTSGDNYAAMQGDGNLVVYRHGGSALWSSNTAGKNGARLEVQSDSNLVIYQGDTPVWTRHGGIGGGQFAHPLQGSTVTQPYACRGGPPCYSTTKYHTGIDLVGGSGIVISPADGEVVSRVNGCTVGDTGCGGGYGNHVKIKFTFTDGTVTYGIFAHLANTNAVPASGCIRKGATLGPVGNTGHTTAAHLHWGMRVNNSDWTGYTTPHPDSLGFLNPTALVGRSYRGC